MNEQRYTIESLAAALDRAPSTVRLWVKSYYTAWIPTIPGTDPTEYPPEAVDVLRVVDGLARQKRKRREIERILAGQFPTEAGGTGPQLPTPTAQHQSLSSSDLVVFLGMVVQQQQEIIARLERIEAGLAAPDTEPQEAAAGEHPQHDTDELAGRWERLRRWWRGIL